MAVRHAMIQNFSPPVSLAYSSYVLPYRVSRVLQRKGFKVTRGYRKIPVTGNAITATFNATVGQTFGNP